MTTDCFRRDEIPHDDAGKRHAALGLKSCAFLLLNVPTRSLQRTTGPKVWSRRAAFWLR